MIKRYFLPRQLHPFAWWGWALALAVAASSTSNPLLLAGFMAVASLVVIARRADSPWGRAFKLYLYLGLFIVVLRVAFRIVFGGGDGPTVLFTLPEVPLPVWVRGIRLLGPVSLEAVLTGFYDGMRLATIIVCVGAANALANPKKLLASLPGALYELGTVMVVAVSALPQLGDSLQRVARARRLRRAPAARGRRQRLKVVETIIVPVLSDALERSLALAASMDVRGYGRAGSASPRDRAVSLALGLGAMSLLAVWAYRFLAAAPDQYVFRVPVASTLLLLAGVTAAVGALRVSGRTVKRSQYRPIRWALAETVAVAAGVGAAAVVYLIADSDDAGALFPSIYPFVWPELTLPLLLALGLAALPTFVTPPPTAVQRRTRA
ncbi:energy-coupling factor transporter transmembrane protein EcfT [Tessaracoccus sp. MC1865]|uniref:energy-coupling factor transporter transmembrane protein EcfT n=1 Tax=Tessaracoccus sp. MC1865 TaxID=2760310 RepID=UPI001FD856DE|nr:energy-coupling factor transporter transmembrane protein EcfT [Tessaracoccus sp. MC1865]